MADEHNLEQINNDNQIGHPKGAPFLKYRGLETFKENSKEGAFIRALANDYYDIAKSNRLPDKMVEKLVKMATEAEILKDYAVSWLSKNPFPKYRPDDPEGSKERRAIYNNVVSAYKSYATLSITLLKILSGSERIPVNTGDDLKSALQVLADKEIKENEKNYTGD